MFTADAEKRRYTDVAVLSAAVVPARYGVKPQKKI